MAIGLVVLFVIGACVFFYNEEWIVAFIFIGVSLFCMLGVWDAFHYNIEINETGISKYGIFRDRHLKLDQIENYKIDAKYLHIFPNTKGVKRIQISRYIRKSSEIEAWAAEHFEDGDVQEFEEDEQLILSDDRYGNNTEEREHNLNKAYKKSRILNVITWISVALGLFYPKPYEYIIAILIVLPLVSMFMVWQSNGLIGFGSMESSSKNSARPSVGLGVFMPAMIIALRGMLDVNIYKYNELIYVCVGFAVLLTFLFVWLSFRYVTVSKKDYVILIPIMMIVFSFYSYGACVTSNTILDQNVGDLYFSKVEHKYISSGKVDTYHLQLSAWGPDALEDDAEVSKSFYNKTQVGDTVVAQLKDGYLGIPWFKVYRK